MPRFVAKQFMACITINAPAHTSLLVHNSLAKNNTIVMPQPLYSSNLAPWDFSLCPKLKRPMKGWRFVMIEEMKTTLLEELKAISKSLY